MNNETLLTLTADIVSAHVANNSVAPGDVSGLVQQVHTALAGLGQAAEPAAEAKVPVVSVRASIKPDYIVCMECGKKQKMLKRHLLTAHGMSPEQYRADYGLPNSYPMVAENYSDRRRTIAKDAGLGRKPGDRPGEGSSAAQAAPKVKGRKSKASATSGETGEAVAGTAEAGEVASGEGE